MLKIKVLRFEYSKGYKRDFKKKLNAWNWYVKVIYSEHLSIFPLVSFYNKILSVQE